MPITGPAVITGEAIRTRLLARPIAAAIRCERSSPWPGVNQARAGCPPTCSRAGSGRPVRLTSRVFQSSSKLAVKAAASSGESATVTRFSWSVHESVVQLVDPVQTDFPSRTTYLWCIRSGIPGMPAVGNGSASISSGAVWGGGGNWRSSWSAL